MGTAESGCLDIGRDSHKWDRIRELIHWLQCAALQQSGLDQSSAPRGRPAASARPSWNSFGDLVGFPVPDGGVNPGAALGDMLVRQASDQFGITRLGRL